MSSLCPFAKGAIGVGSVCPMKSSEKSKESNNSNTSKEEKEEKNVEEDKIGPATIPAKCPFGYDSETFKLGPLSCMICQALLFDSSKCMPCAHKFCKVCISRFRDCPLCGADIEKIEPDTDLQATVDRFIDGHARIKRTQSSSDKGEETVDAPKKVIYEDVSMERGAFLVQQAMRAFRARNVESAKSRLDMCAEDIREQLKVTEDSQELCSQLGAVLGMLGDCCRSMGDGDSAVKYYEESTEFLSKLPSKDLEVVHTLSVSLNKVGDLRYYAGDLQSARSYYVRSLEVRRQAVKDHSNVSSQVIDLATSLAKVADVNRNLGEDKAAIEGFEEAVQCLQALKLDSAEAALEKKRRSVLDFLQSQLTENSNHVSSSPA